MSVNAYNRIALLLALTFLASSAQAMPAFARQYEISCNACHVAFPRLNAFGESFVDDMNMRLPSWRTKTTSSGDDELALPSSLPLAVRMQSFVQSRNGEQVDPATGPTGKRSGFDFQTPYLIKLLSSAPLSDHITYYFYGIFAEKGENGSVIIEDAWFQHDDVLGTGVTAQLGQFQVSDLMFPREVRMTFQDFMVYRMAGLTYERGILLSRGLGSLDAALGVVNGSGISTNFNINSPGLRRPDRMFDNDSGKTVFGRLGTTFHDVKIGAFGLTGKQKAATGFAGTGTSTRDTDRHTWGIDVSGTFKGKFFWFGQAIWNRWNGFLDPAINYRWNGGFLGVDYIPGGRWAYSVLWNHVNAGDFANTGSIYEGLAMRTLTFGTNYYFMRNVKGVAELNIDLLKKKDHLAGSPFVGHLSSEHSFLVGLDVAF